MTEQTKLLSAGSLAEDLWDRTVEAIAIFAIAPQLGLLLRGRPSFARDILLTLLREFLPQGAPIVRLPVGSSAGALLGGLDLTATLAAGTPVHGKGLILRSHDGVLVLPMAERIQAEAAGVLAQFLDRGTITCERDGLSGRFTSSAGLLALDEGIDDERPPFGLTERLGLVVDLNGADPRRSGEPVVDRMVIEEARVRFANIHADSGKIENLCVAAAALGVGSLRAPSQALLAARAAAALSGSATIDEVAMETALRLVICPRATQTPSMPVDSDESQSEERNESDGPERKGLEGPQPSRNGDPGGTSDEPEETSNLPADLVIDAADATLPYRLLERLAATIGPEHRVAHTSGSGATSKAARRGRIIGTRPGDSRRDRIDVVATLMAAAPWQALRRRNAANDLWPTGSMMIRSEDLRVRRFRSKQESATVFAVDASGSAALERLAEAKGAVERILAECYVRRDRVALVAFRGTSADLLLPETRSLTSAKRSLAALAAGGGTPLAKGISTALAVALQCARNGRTPLVALLSDGRANVSAGGVAGRAAAVADALAAAAKVRAAGIASLVIDTAQRPGTASREIADAMGATYLALPRGNANALSAAVADVGSFRLSGKTIARNRR